MKWYLKILKSFLFVLLINLIVLLSISFNIKRLLLEGIVVETIKDTIVKQNYKTENLIIPEEEINAITDDERVREILKSKEIQDLLNKYLDITIDTIIDEESIEEIELEKDILEYLSDNKETLSKAVGQDITEEMIDSTKKQFEGKDMSRAFKQTLNNTKNSVSKEEKIVLKGYKVLRSQSFRLGMIFCIIVTLILIAMIQKSFHKWVLTLGEAITISGILLIAFNFILKQILFSATKSFVLHANSFLYSSLQIMISGIIITAIYMIIARIITKRKEKQQNVLS